MNINEIHNVNLIPFDEIENYTTALKNFVLYTKIDETVVIALSKDYISISLDYLIKTTNSSFKVSEYIVFFGLLVFKTLLQSEHKIMIFSRL